VGARKSGKKSDQQQRKNQREKMRMWPYTIERAGGAYRPKRRENIREPKERRKPGREKKNSYRDSIYKDRTGTLHVTKNLRD